MMENANMTTAAQPLARVGEVTFTPPAFVVNSITTRGSAVVLPGPRVALVVQPVLVDRTIDALMTPGPDSAADNGHVR